MARMILNETSYFGAGCRKEVVGELKRRNMKKAFVVSDKDLVKFGVAKKVTDVLEGAGVAYDLFDDVKANPTIHNVQCGLAEFKKSNADVIIAIGGGSVMDTAKAIGIIATNPEFADVKSLEGTADTKNKSFPIIAFATTSGTAAEVTINYVITDEEAGRKLVCVDPNDIPIIAFNDAEMLMSMPKGLTAATGMDALTHAIEAYITPGATPISDLMTWNSIKFIAENLETAVKDGSNAARARAWLTALTSRAWRSPTWGSASCTPWRTPSARATTSRTALRTRSFCLTLWNTINLPRSKNSAISPARWASTSRE